MVFLSMYKEYIATELGREPDVFEVRYRSLHHFQLICRIVLIRWNCRFLRSREAGSPSSRTNAPEP